MPASEPQCCWCLSGEVGSAVKVVTVNGAREPRLLWAPRSASRASPGTAVPGSARHGTGTPSSDPPARPALPLCLTPPGVGTQTSRHQLPPALPPPPRHSSLPRPQNILPTSRGQSPRGQLRGPLTPIPASGPLPLSLAPGGRGRGPRTLPMHLLLGRQAGISGAHTQRQTSLTRRADRTCLRRGPGWGGPGRRWPALLQGPSSRTGESRAVGGRV